VLAALFALALRICPAATVPTPASRITLKDGTIYRLKEPPRISGGRIIFTTTEDRIYSLAESDVLAIEAEPTPTPTPRVYSPLDSHNLGVIAREQRQKTGKKTEIGRTVPSPAPTRTPRPPKRAPTPR
jgi:hypothetical protein